MVDFDFRNGGWIGIDLDRTLAHYDKWRGPTHIGEPIPEMVQFVKKLIDEGHEVRIFTARMSEYEVYVRDQIEKTIADWTEKHIGHRLFATCVKDYGCKAIFDDIAFHTVPNTGKIVTP